MLATSTRREMAQPALRRRAWLVPALVLVLALLALVLRLWLLDKVPPWLWWDEATQGLDARDLLHGHFQVFFPRAQGKEPFYIYLTVPFVAAWDGRAFAVRLAGAILGALTVPAVYLAGRALWSERSAAGAWAGLAAAGFWVTNFWPQSINRIGFQVNALPLPLTLAVVTWLSWTRRPSRRRACTFGLLAGLTVATYLAARITPLLWIALYLALPRNRRRALHASLPWAILAFALFTVPLGVYFALHPQNALERVTMFANLYGAPTPGEQLGLLWDNVRLVLGGFLGYAGDPIPRHNIPNRPPFSPLLAVLFGLGLVTALIALFRRGPGRGASRERAWTLLAWWGVICLPAILSANSNPHFPRLLGALPAAFLLAAWPIAAVARWASGLTAPQGPRADQPVGTSGLRVPSSGRQGAERFRLAGIIGGLAGRRSSPGPGSILTTRRVQLALAGALTILLGLEGVVTARAYFATWAGRADLYTWFQGDMWTIGRQAAARPGTLTLVPADAASGDGLAYAYRDLPIWTVDASAADPGDWLSGHLGDRGGTKIMTPVWREEPYVYADPQGAVPFYLSREGVMVGEEHPSGFDLQTFQLGSQPQFAAAGRAVLLERSFGPGITLREARWGAAFPNVDRSGGAAAAGTSFWVVLAWRMPRPPEGLRVAVDAVDASGHRVASAEGPLVDDRGPALPWPTDGAWRTYHLLPLPAVQPPGSVRLEVRLYQAASLNPVLPQSGTSRLSVPLAEAEVLPALQPVPAASVHPERMLQTAFGPDLSLVGASGLPADFAPGQSLALQFFWQVSGSGYHRSLPAVLSLGDAITATVDLPPGVPAGHVLRAFADLHVPADTPTGALPLRLAPSGGFPPVDLGRVQVAGRPRLFDPPVLTQPFSASFGDRVALLGLDVNGREIRVTAGQAVTVTFAWQVRAAPGASLVRFLHALGPDGRPVAQQDGIPCLGDCPAISWLPGEVLVDRIRISTSPDLPAGTYPLAVGWFDPASGIRLPARDTANQPLPEGLLRLPLTLVVQPGE